MPGLFRAGLAASRLLQAITGPAAVVRSFGATFFPSVEPGNSRARSPFYNGGALPAPVLPLACLLPGSVEIDRGFSPPRYPGMPGLLLFWAAGHSPGSWLASALASPPPPSKWPSTVPHRPS